MPSDLALWAKQSEIEKRIANQVLCEANEVQMLRADQGHALRQVIAYSTIAIVEAIAKHSGRS